MEIAFDIITSVINLGMLIVSIVVFVNTIKKTENERYVNSFMDRLHSFLEKTDKFFRETDPQTYFDDYSVIYSEGAFNYSDTYAEIKRRNSTIKYISQELFLFMPESGEVFDIIVRLLDVLKDKAIYINDVFCEDIKLFSNGQQEDINIQRIDSALSEYDTVYKDIVETVFKGLHIMQESVATKDKNKIEEYKSLYGKKYIDEI